MPLLPDPEPRPRRFPVISVDDHLIEPPDLFEGRMPAHLVDVAPRLVEFENGKQAWAYEDKLFPNIGLNAVIGRPKDEWTMDPARFDEMRKGCWDIHARIADMDVAGIWASLCFPSLIAGFAGVAFAKSNDPELGLACVRAWNDWHHDVWAGTYPERMIPLQLVWLGDPEVAAADVRRNAERGFKAITFPESMNNLGLPSVHTDHWDPLLRACEETGTVVCIHTGSGRIAPPTSPESPLEQSTTLFPVHGMLAAADWLWARIPLRFPTLNLALSEGGIGWVPMLLDRLDYVMEHSASGMAGAWGDGDLTPSRGRAAQLLVLLHRRPDHAAGARPHRRRPHHGGERLPARRLLVARHPGPPGRALRRAARRRRGQAHPRERRPPLPPPPSSRGVGPGGVRRS